MIWKPKYANGCACLTQITYFTLLLLAFVGACFLFVYFGVIPFLNTWTKRESMTTSKCNISNYVLSFEEIKGYEGCVGGNGVGYHTIYLNLSTYFQEGISDLLLPYVYE